MSYQSWFLVYLQLPQARLLQHPRLLQVKKLIIQITIHQSSQVKVWIDKHGETRTLLKHLNSCYMNQPKSKNQKNEDHEQVRGSPYSDIPEWLQEFRENPVKKEFLNTETHTRVLLMNHLQNLWEVWIWVSTVFKLTSRKTEIARSARGPKSQEPRAEDALAEPYIVQKILVTWLQQITRSSLKKKANLETITDMQSWCRTWPPTGSNGIVQNKNFSGNAEELAIVLGAE